MSTDFWESMIASVTLPDAMARIRRIAIEADARRSKADYDTGSICEDEAFYLMALAEHIGAHTVIEVGTFIGTSTMALAAASTVKAVYTCDVSNDCLHGQRLVVVRPYPMTTSTDMLADLVLKGVKADLCFFDGVLNSDDVPMLQSVTHRDTCYAFHDYNHGPKIRMGKQGTYLEQVPRKGIGNVRMLQPVLPDHVLIEPRHGSTMALLVPESLA